MIYKNGAVVHLAVLKKAEEVKEEKVEDKPKKEYKNKTKKEHK